MIDCYEQHLLLAREIGDAGRGNALEIWQCCCTREFFSIDSAARLARARELATRATLDFVQFGASYYAFGNCLCAIEVITSLLIGAPAGIEIERNALRIEARYQYLAR